MSDDDVPSLKLSLLQKVYPVTLHSSSSMEQDKETREVPTGTTEVPTTPSTSTSTSRGILVEIVGRIVGRRRISRRLAFYDIECFDERPVVVNVFDDDDGLRGDDDDALKKIVDLEMVVKSGRGAFETDDDVARTQKEFLKLGNAVRARGRLSRRAPGSHGEWSLACEEVMELVESWAESRPGVAFSREGRIKGGDGTAVEPSAGPCKFFLNNGKCAKGDRCKYVHDRGMREEWIASRKANRRDIAVKTFGDPHGDSVASKQLRAVKFAEWLVDTFGVETLNAGSGVLDVAGGRGDVSFELHTKRGIKSTLVEPRLRKLNKHQHKWLRAETKKAKMDDQPPLVLDDMLCAQVRTEFTPENWHLFKDCSLVVGMHPDQATDAIVDFAVKYNKPFAVVPCCVFPQLFHHRRDRDGNPITERLKLVEYLADKAEGEIAYLDIEGANQVVFAKSK